MVRPSPTLALSSALIAMLTLGAAAGQVALPNKSGTVKFAVIGDTGTGGSEQMKVAKQLTAARAQFPFTFAVMLGDNLYGSERPTDFVDKFERPYKALLDAGVTFHAALGNHDDPNQRFYKQFNMNGERYYSFKPPDGSVRFFALDSNYVDKTQLEWLEKELAASDSQWKIAFFHHPLYSSGEKHGSDRRCASSSSRCSSSTGSTRLRRPRAFLRAHQAAEGHHALRRRQRREAAQGQHRQLRNHRQGFRSGIRVRADGDRRRHAAVPGDQRRGQDHRPGQHPAARGQEVVR